MGNPSIIHLPDGQNFTVTPVFAGLFFKSHELVSHRNAFPIGWTVVLQTEELIGEAGKPASTTHERKSHNGGATGAEEQEGGGDDGDRGGDPEKKQAHSKSQHKRQPSRIKSFGRPTLQDDFLFISSISNPSSSDFKPAASPTRQIAMMLWITLYWYFHQPAPSSLLPATAESAGTPEGGRPRGEWRIAIQRNGVLRGRNLIPKLERMGLVSTLDSAVGAKSDEFSDEGGNGSWAHMFVSRRAFWQIPARLFLFTLQPNSSRPGSSNPGSPVASRPGSPTPAIGGIDPTSPGVAKTAAALAKATPPQSAVDVSAAATAAAMQEVALTPLVPAPSFPIGPFFSSSHLPTYYPPAPPQYTMTGHVRHPVRPKPPRMGEVFYSRFVPSAGAYLSFRVASSSSRPVTYLGAVGPAPPPGKSGPSLRAAAQEHAHLGLLSDTALLQRWLAKPRVHRFWGAYVPDFLTRALESRHSFPVIALWDGVPFAYLEFYWVKEDVIGRYLGGAGGSAADDWDRGVHVLIGEEWARGQVPLWLSSVVHWILCADYRTMSVCVEPRVDNQRFIQHLQAGGFDKVTEISLPHKQAWFGKLRRENWEGPAL